MEWFVAVVIVAALGVAAVVAAGGVGGMAKEPVRDTYRQDLPRERSLNASDINALRFGTALRGYAMDQVDDVLDRLAREINERDTVIAELRASLPVDDEGSRESSAQSASADPQPALNSQGSLDPRGLPEPGGLPGPGGLPQSSRLSGQSEGAATLDRQTGAQTDHDDVPDTWVAPGTGAAAPGEVSVEPR